MKRARPSRCCRRDFCKRVGLGAASLGAAGPGMAEAREAETARAGHVARTVLLSRTGGDRATAYLMTGKIVRRQGLLLCTRGINAAGYSRNRNRVETEVWLQLP